MVEKFSGSIYRNSKTSASDAAWQFETGGLMLKDVLITVATYNMLLGDVDTQDFPMPTSAYWGPKDLDLSTLYFKNAGAGENGVVYIIATRA